MCSCEFYGGPDGTFISHNVELLGGENFIEHCSLSDRLFGAVNCLGVIFHKSYLLLYLLELTDLNLYITF